MTDPAGLGEAPTTSAPVTGGEPANLYGVFWQDDAEPWGWAPLGLYATVDEALRHHERVEREGDYPPVIVAHVPIGEPLPDDWPRDVEDVVVARRQDRGTGPAPPRDDPQRHVTIGSTITRDKSLIVCLCGWSGPAGDWFEHAGGARACDDPCPSGLFRGERCDLEAGHDGRHRSGPLSWPES